jgi:hypothetical protein
MKTSPFGWTSRCQQALRCVTLLAATIVPISYAEVDAASRTNRASKPPPRADVEVDLELVVAIDVSGSMSAEERVKQRAGYASAFRHPDVLAAIENGPLGRIAVAYVAWGGPGEQELMLPWSVIASDEDAARFSAAIAATQLGFPRPVSPWLTGTSISSALNFAARLLDENGFIATRRAIDISGDGPNNSGPPVLVARQAVVAKGIVINGLPLELGKADLPIDAYYEHCVIGGPGAFSIVVSDPNDFSVAIRRKLALEIADLMPTLLVRQIEPVSNSRAPDFCDSGIASYGRGEERAGNASGGT